MHSELVKGNFKTCLCFSLSFDLPPTCAPLSTKALLMMMQVFIVLVHGIYSSIYIHNGLGNKYKNCKDHVFKYRTLLKTIKIIKTLHHHPNILFIRPLQCIHLSNFFYTKLPLVLQNEDKKSKYSD